MAWDFIEDEHGKFREGAMRDQTALQCVGELGYPRYDLSRPGKSK